MIKFKQGMPDDWYKNDKRWKKKRKEMYIKQKGICQNCFKIALKWNCDHITPISENSPDILKYGDDNLQILCISCHNKKSVHDKENYQRYVTDEIDNIIMKGVK